MNRENFVKVVEEALDSLPQEFRSRIQNVAVLVEDVPRTSYYRSRAAKATTSRCLPWRAHNQEEHL